MSPSVAAGAGAAAEQSPILLAHLDQAVGVLDVHGQAKAGPTALAQDPKRRLEVRSPRRRSLVPDPDARVEVGFSGAVKEGANDGLAIFAHPLDQGAEGSDHEIRPEAAHGLGPRELEGASSARALLEHQGRRIRIDTPGAAGGPRRTSSQGPTQIEIGSLRQVGPQQVTERALVHLRQCSRNDRDSRPLPMTRTATVRGEASGDPTP